MDSKSNMYPHVHDAPPQYGDYNAPAMIPAETAPQPSVITVQQPNVYVQPPIQNNNLGRMPVTVTCPSCHTRQRTNVNHEPSTKTHLLALLICLVGGICCWCIPYYRGSCQNVIHTCRLCGEIVGIFKN
ncbi:lipopolysaccharide-induced tumor necrosis factor-alpha factor homolog isoform X2 [Drosophila innubila]|uniref:lipopolysaccharide-induced tumor necrosis factor-alpha factor homolog isoform X2 n=1 Tax=Drosophila innubila TaxID=198719 RepID=UPI00148C9030|nr:lipopolysaccharide-induced tumor necrosis factor-alpha factor homolog isoform X2 [Drosophila innubila]